VVHQREIRGKPRRDQGYRGEPGHHEAVEEPENDSDDLPGASPQRPGKDGEPQSEKVCNHSIPSALLRPPASSTNLSSRVIPPRTSSMDPETGTCPFT